MLFIYDKMLAYLGKVKLEKQEVAKLKKTKEEQISTALRRELWVTLSGLMDSCVGLGTVHSPSTA